MAREDSPYIVGDYWLEKRRDGQSPEVWQIAWYDASTRQVRYRSTRRKSLDDAKPIIHAHVDHLRSKQAQATEEARIIPILLTYWEEHGRKAVSPAQIASSLRTFMGFLFQDEAGMNAVVSDITPAMIERFREWRMGPHSYDVPWGGKDYRHSSNGVNGESVQRNVDDLRSAVNHAERNRRLPWTPKIPSILDRYRSAPRERILSWEELGMIAWYSSHFPSFGAYVARMIATAARPEAAAAFDAAAQYDGGRLIDLHPPEWERTKKRNPVVPAIRPLRPILRASVAHETSASHGKAWRTMRSVLGLPDDVVAKTIRHTIATRLRQDKSVPSNQISDLLGHLDHISRTTRVYAKYDPDFMAETERALTKIWLRVRKEAKAYGAVHLLTKAKRGINLSVDRIDR